MTLFALRRAQMPAFCKRKAPFPAVLIVAGLAGCAGVSADWVKPGVSEAQVKADNAACRAEADEAYGATANITQDIQVSRPRSPSDVSRRAAEIRSYETERDYDKVFAACMMARGYKKRDAGG
jgi:hypothetical protein